jgi:hypothetical protein
VVSAGASHARRSFWFASRKFRSIAQPGIQLTFEAEHFAGAPEGWCVIPAGSV